MDFDSGIFPLGWIAPTPGNPSDLFVNYPELRNENFYCNEIIIQAGASNVGNAYFGNARLNTLSGEGVIVVLVNPGDVATFGTIAGNVYRLSDYRVDVDVPGDGVLVSVYVR